MKRLKKISVKYCILSGRNSLSKIKLWKLRDKEDGEKITNLTRYFEQKTKDVHQTQNTKLKRKILWM